MNQGLDGQRLAWPPDEAWAAVVIQRDGPRLILRVRGEADVHTRDGLRADLMSGLDEGVREVLVDVSELTFCDLAGSDVLHDFVEEVTARAVPVQVSGMSPLLAIIYSAFPPPRPAGTQHGRQVRWTGPAGHDSFRGGPLLELSGDTGIPDVSRE
ncbi:STAS domain-containing protein [Cellulomonas aerilata]|nr:STAS domain-containing protein [Cellulomonas aerilata]